MFRYICKIFRRLFRFFHQILPNVREILLRSIATGCSTFLRWFSRPNSFSYLCRVVHRLYRPIKPKSEEDEFYCEYDSTWETSGTIEDRPTSRQRRSDKFNRFRNAARDMQNYRRDYPNLNTQYPASRHKQDDMPNLKFYLGQRTSCPDGFKIDEFHKKWFGDYTHLERVHTFIQWLFPLQEQGMNSQAIKLTKEEIQAFRENQAAKDNLLKSYKLMLDFYGIELSDEKTGEVKRADNWQNRFKNLDRNTHNNLRITRILKCLGTLGYEHYQAPLVHFFLEQTLVHSQLDNVKESVLNYFMFTVRDKQQRRALIKYAYDNFDHRSEFVWCSMTIQNMWSKERNNQDCNTGHEEKTQNNEEDKNTKTPYQGGTYSDDDQDQDRVTTPPTQPSHQAFFSGEFSHDIDCSTRHEGKTQIQTETEEAENAKPQSQGGTYSIQITT